MYGHWEKLSKTARTTVKILNLICTPMGRWHQSPARREVTGLFLAKSVRAVIQYTGR